MSRRYARNVLKGQPLSSAHAPGAGSPADRLPRDTIHGLLQHLGYTNGVKSHAGSRDLRAAIIAFQKQRGLPVTGQPSVKLLGQLIPAAN